MEWRVKEKLEEKKASKYRACHECKEAHEKCVLPGFEDIPQTIRAKASGTAPAKKKTKMESTKVASPEVVDLLGEILEVIQRIDARTLREVERNSKFQKVVLKELADIDEKNSEYFVFMNETSKRMAAIMQHMGLPVTKRKGKGTESGVPEAGGSKGPETKEGEGKGGNEGEGKGGERNEAGISK
ncbi:hypothetical protein CPB83DRAFT_892469 [Crepidotus variabilis]|uniref:Uncharacterized protein n=1 Tax=Crepidotus variabilis TaxID=179855 RepID=A0A9P6JSG0_9AGAR|nr:hypothetical protein CPB83DRAFT_892469 [Crepidotus variabilis]